MSRSNSLRDKTATIIVVSMLLGCGGSDTTAPDVVPTMKVEAGAGQTATVGTATASQLSVIVTDNHGAHASGVTVTFVPDSGGGSVATAAAATDASGVASAGVWTVGTRAHDQNLIASATVNSVPLRVTFAVTATPDRPSVVAVVAGGGQDGPYGATLITPVRVLATDKYSNPTPGARVRFSVDTGGVTDGAVTTGADGTATTRLRLPVTTGQVLLTARLDTVATATSTLTSRGVRFASFSMDANTTCGLSVEGYPYCWGDNAVGQMVSLGMPAGQNAIAPQAIPADLSLTSISLGNIGGCGLRVDGGAVCWGSNASGENGNGTTSSQLDRIAPVAGNLVFSEIQRGPSVACGTTRSGQSYCWGAGFVGELGAVSAYTSNVDHPTLIDGGITFHSYALGTLHSCALDPAGKAYCWGMNLQGRLGVGTASSACNSSTTTSSGTVTIQTTCSPSPVSVNTSLRFATLVASSSATCGLDASGSAYCWGSNEFGELGRPGVPSDTAPTAVPGTPAFTQLSGHDRGFCGLTSGGDIYCWGYVASILGVPYASCTNYSDCTPVATKINVSRQFSKIAFTTGQLCGLSNGVAYCWGTDYHGALGIGAADDLNVGTPTAVAGQTP